jgi:16S rRNA (cytosine1402-N4)-methyltransferase
MKESAQWSHQTVLCTQAVEALVSRQDGHYVDATFGRGGHTRLLLKTLGRRGTVTAFDKDFTAIQVGLEIEDPRLQMRHSSFTALADLPVKSVAGILMDLGVSSPQIDDAERGFSFQNDGPLDMRMDATKGVTVAQWLKNADWQEIKEVIHEYGEERYAFQIAKAIVACREKGGSLTRTSELAKVVASAVKTRESGKNPATRTFQAFRIFINRELEDLRQALEASLRVLEPGGRLVVISFHSLEDRMVKQFIAENAREKTDRRLPFLASAVLRLKALGRIKPSEEEVRQNPRARSAVMRVAERLDGAY